MGYSMEIIRKAEQNTSMWSGGTTTQLAIFPKDAVYSERNFLWRISSAKVEVEESLFTHLPGIWRLIMVLEGELRLEHEGHHKAALVPFEQDSFSGDWTTRSFGKVTDFNLMMAHGCSGELDAISLKMGTVEIFPPMELQEYTRATEALYCVAGKADIHIDGGLETLETGDFFLIHTDESSSASPIKIGNSNKNETTIIRARVYYPGK